MKSIPIVSRRKVARQGGSILISIPKDWFEAHGIDMKKIRFLLMVANSDIRIVNPKKEKEIANEVSKLVKLGEYTER